LIGRGLSVFLPDTADWSASAEHPGALDTVRNNAQGRSEEAAAPDMSGTARR
jgi:hypothetical protein